jgi:hypothetical protein
MIAVDDVGRHELVEQSRHGLNADKAGAEAADDKKACGLVGPVVALKVLLGLWKHAIQRGEEHDAKAQAEGTGQENITVLDAKVLLAGEQAYYDIDADYGRAKHAS